MLSLGKRTGWRCARWPKVDLSTHGGPLHGTVLYNIRQANLESVHDNISRYGGQSAIVLLLYLTIFHFQICGVEGASGSSRGWIFYPTSYEWEREDPTNWPPHAAAHGIGI